LISQVSLGTLFFRASTDLPEFKDSRIADLPRGHPIVTTCALGGQATIAAALLVEYGFTNVKVMDGGCVRMKKDVPGTPNASKYVWSTKDVATHEHASVVRASVTESARSSAPQEPPAKLPEPPRPEAAPSCAAFSEQHARRAETTDGACPADLAAAAEAALAGFERALADVDSWDAAKVAKDRGGIRVRSRPAAGSAAHTFRVDATFEGLRAQQLADAFKYENRLDWDPTITTPAYLQRYAHGEHTVDVVCYTTKPAAGGMVSSRGFVDLRFTVRVDDPAAGTSRTVILNSEARPSPLLAPPLLLLHPSLRSLQPSLLPVVASSGARALQ